MPNDPERGPGRPKKTPEEKAKRTRFSVSTSVELEERLQQAAKENNRDRSAEAADRLEASFGNELFMVDFDTPEVFGLCRIIGGLISSSQRWNSGFDFDDPQAHSELKADVCAILDAFGPDGGVPAPGPDVSSRARGHLTQLYNMKKHGRDPADESASAIAAEEILEALGKFADRLEPKQ